MKLNSFRMDLFHHQSLHIILGDLGTGKTWLSLYLMKYLDNQFSESIDNYDNVHYIDHLMDLQCHYEHKNREILETLFPLTILKSNFHENMINHPYSLFCFDRKSLPLLFLEPFPQHEEKLVISNIIFLTCEINRRERIENCDYLYLSGRQPQLELLWERLFELIFPNYIDFKDFFFENTCDYHFLVFEQKTFHLLVKCKPDNMEIKDMDKRDFFFKISCTILKKYNEMSKDIFYSFFI